MRLGFWSEHKGRWWAITTFALVVLSAGCDKGDDGDTCSGGSNMENVQVSVGARTGSTTEVTITWDPGTGPGASLPDAYFEKVEVVGGASRGTAHFSTERTITATLSSTPELADGGNSVLRFVLLFPDRRTAIACRHTGMADQYFLTVTLTFDSSGSLGESTAEESVSLGNV